MAHKQADVRWMSCEVIYQLCLKVTSVEDVRNQVIEVSTALSLRPNLTEMILKRINQANQQRQAGR